jgi:hypothetical protein
LTYGPAGDLQNTWNPAPQDVEASAYSKDDDAVFVLGDSDVPHGASTTNYLLLVEYSRDGRILKGLFPANNLQDGGDWLSARGENGEPALRVTKDRIYLLRSKASRSGDVRPQRGSHAEPEPINAYMLWIASIYTFRRNSRTSPYRSVTTHLWQPKIVN